MLRKHFSCFILILSFLMVSANTLSAESAYGPIVTGPSLELSLRNAIEMGLLKNRDLKTARRSLSIAASNYRAAKAQYYPTISAGLNASPSASQSDLLSSIENLYSGGVEINFRIPLDISGTINRSVKQALISLSIAKAQYISASQDLVVQIFEQYYTALANAETIKINEAQVALAQEQLRTAKTRLRAGRVPEGDVLTAKVQLNNEKQNLKVSEREYDISLANLKNTLLLKQTSKIVLTSRIGYEPEFFRYRESVKEALQNRLEIKIAKLNMEASKIGVKSTFDPYRPTLDVTSNLGYFSSGSSFIDTFDNRPSRPTWSVRATINVPLFIFDGGTIRESVTRATIGRRQAEADFEQVREALELEIKNVLISLNNARERVKIVKDNINLAKESLRITEVRYRMGKTSYLELVDSRNNLKTSELNLLSALTGHSLSKIRFYRSLGRPLAKQRVLDQTGFR